VTGLNVAAELGMAQGVDAALDGSGWIQAPVQVGQVLSELFVRLRLGIELPDIVRAEFQVGAHVFVGHDDDLRGEAMAQGVEAGALFALRRARTGLGGARGDLFRVGLFRVGSAGVLSYLQIR